MPLQLTAFPIDGDLEGSARAMAKRLYDERTIVAQRVVVQEGRTPLQFVAVGYPIPVGIVSVMISTKPEHVALMPEDHFGILYEG